MTQSLVGTKSKLGSSTVCWTPTTDASTTGKYRSISSPVRFLDDNLFLYCSIEPILFNSLLLLSMNITPSTRATNIDIPTTMIITRSTPSEAKLLNLFTILSQIDVQMTCRWPLVPEQYPQIRWVLVEIAEKIVVIDIHKLILSVWERAHNLCRWRGVFEV